MANNQIYEKWLRVNVDLHNALEELKALDAERENIGKDLQTADPQKLIVAMKQSTKKYDILLQKIKNLKEVSANLKQQIDKK
jgi:hypothetical protein